MTISHVEPKLRRQPWSTRQIIGQTMVRSIRARALRVMTWFVLFLAIASPALGQPAKPRGCLPVSERTGDSGCWIMAREPLGQLSRAAVFWHLDTYPTRAAAEAAKVRRSTVVEALGNIWLFTIGDAGWRPSGGTRVAEIGPLAVKPDEGYTAQYMEGITPAGTFTPVHRHPGPEAWYTAAGELCLETPDGKMLGRAGEGTIVQAGSPMQLRATGREQGRWLVLGLHETSQRWEIPASDWTPKGLCKT
jgi:quercetin dioxygenase-like cupin family protein